MLVELVQILINDNGSCTVGKIRINPDHITYIVEDRRMIKNLAEGKINLGLREDVGFTRIKLNGRDISSEITVIGNPNVIESKLSQRTKRILKG